MLKKTLIIGAGEAGKMVAKEILDNSRLSDQYSLLGFLDDDEKKKSYYGIPVLGKLCESREVLGRYGIETVIIAIPSASRETVTEILLSLSYTGADIKIVPGIYEIIDGNVNWKQIRKVKPEDFLGREEVGFDLEEISPFYNGKTVLVTGAGGSIGSEIFRQILKLPLSKAVAFGRGENNIHTLINSLGKDNRFDYVIGDVQDYNKILYTLKEKKPDIVFHAAAHKHVPIMEEFPEEAVKNNIIGTYNTVRACVEAGVKGFVFISTDKAVNPTSIMGATKRISEKIALAFNQAGKTRFICTRFGNVLGSRGSVIPTFMQQIEKGGPLTITHPDIERYFMSIPEAARLVIKSITVEDGNIFVLNMGKPIKILELAKNLIRFTGHTEKEIPIIFTGLRKGEKINEELFTDSENLKPTRFEKLQILGGEKNCLKLNEIPSLIEELRALAASVDRNAIRKMIKRLVPEFIGKETQNG